MRILVVGATGTIGRAVVSAFQDGHEVVAATRHTDPVRVDIADPDSIRAMYRAVGRLDAVVSAAGVAKFAPLPELTDADFESSLANKLMGQVNLVRFGLDHVADSGSFTLTGGVLARSPIRGSAAISTVNSALEGFVRAAAFEAPRGIRVNVVSPTWVTDTLAALGMDTSRGLAPAHVAALYVRSVTSALTGAVIEAGA